MRDFNLGILPIFFDGELVGTVTDRDITVRALAEGKNVNACVKDIMTEAVIYCYENDDVLDALKQMQQASVQRLMVLNESRTKQLVGIISLGDIADSCRDLSSMRAIAECCNVYQ